MNHNEPPIKNLSRSDAKLLEDAKHRILKSDYYRDISSVFELIDGRFVKETMAGNSGYVLVFNHQLYSVAALFENKLMLMIGTGEINQDHIDFINSPIFGDGKNPQIDLNIPYCDRYCDIARELTYCKDKQIDGISIGENSFNICFEDDFELDSTLFLDKAGKLTLRVFWEK